MTGQELYELRLAELLAQCNCGADRWDELMARDQDVWNAMAERINVAQQAVIDATVALLTV